MALNIENLTMGEIALLEKHAEASFDEAFADGRPRGNALAALGMIAKRRAQMANNERPTFSWNEAQDLTLDQVYELLGWEVEPDAPETEDEDAEGHDPKDLSVEPASRITSTTSNRKKNPQK